MVYGPIPEERKNDFSATGVFTVLEVKNESDQITAGRLAMNDFQAACSVSFNPPITTRNGQECFGAFIPNEIMSAFVRANNGLYPIAGEEISVAVRPDASMGNVVLSMRPAIGGTRSVAA